MGNWRSAGDAVPVVVLLAALSALIVWMVLHADVGVGFAVGVAVGFVAGLKW
ncbi:MAG: hypothetical protein ACYCOR_10920 [Acidobacteriaceae bacterium]